MIKKIKNTRTQKETEPAEAYQLQEDQFALTQLLQMFDKKVFFPLTSWSVSPKEILHICNDIVINDRKNIIEFGSGFSTICIAQLLKISHKKSIFLSIENDANWAVELSKILNRMDLQDYVKIVVAPIADIAQEFAKEGQKKWYDTQVLSNELSTIDKIDLVIVDGPYGGTTPYARYSAIPFLKNKMAINYNIFLDDSARNDEKQIVLDWKQILNSKLKNYIRYSCLEKETRFDSAPYGNKF